MSQKKYDSIFQEQLPVAKALLTTVTNIVVAGGAAAKPLYTKREYCHSDIDIFIYGILDINLFWEKVSEIVTFITLQYPQSKIIHKIKKGLISLNITNTNTEYQIILRMYHTLSSIIHSFDIPSSSICYTGTDTYTTTLGSFAFSRQINLTNPEYRSNNYESRLNKYFKRGFAISLPYLIVENNIIEHRYLNYDILKNLTDNIYVVGSEYKSIADDSYSTFKNDTMQCINYLNFLQNLESYGIVLENDIVDYKQFYKFSIGEIINNLSDINIVITKYITRILLTPVCDILQTNLPNNLIISIIKLIISKQTIKVYSIIRTFLIDISLKFNWIIISNPHEQFSSSIIPNSMSNLEWYGY